MLVQMIPFLRKAGQFFEEGKKIAKAALYACVVGAWAVATLLAEVIGLSEEDSVVGEVEEPP